MAFDWQTKIGVDPTLAVLCRKSARLFAVTALVASMGLATAGFAAEASTDLEERLRRLEQLLEAQSQKIAEQEWALKEQERIIAEQQEALERMTGEVDKQRVTLQLHLDPEPPWTTQAGSAPALTADYYGGLRYDVGSPIHPAGYTTAGPGATQVAGAHTQRAQAEEAAPTQPAEPERRPEILTGIAERGGVLTPAGTLIVEPSVEYVHDSSDRVVIEGFAVLPAILIGSIDVRRVDRDSLFGAITGRYGITDRIEIDAKVPYVYREDRTLAREIAVESTAATVTEVTGHGLGDVQLGAHYQINSGTGGWPFFIANLRIKAPTGEDPFEVDVDDETGLQTELPTGTGFWSVEPSVTFITRSDPVVWWGNVKFLWNVERDIGGGFGTINPGNAVGSTVGIGFGVNPDTSFSLGWEHVFVFESKQDGRTIEGTDLQLGSFLLGLSYRLSQRVTINLTFQAGVTDDATDTRLLLRVPIRLSLL